MLCYSTFRISLERQNITLKYLFHHTFLGALIYNFLNVTKVLKKSCEDMTMLDIAVSFYWQHRY